MHSSHLNRFISGSSKINVALLKERATMGKRMLKNLLKNSTIECLGHSFKHFFRKSLYVLITYKLLLPITYKFLLLNIRVYRHFLLLCICIKFPFRCLQQILSQKISREFFKDSLKKTSFEKNDSFRWYSKDSSYCSARFS